MRDKLRKKEYFDTFIEEELEDIQMFKDSLADGEIENDRIDSIKDEILLIKMGVIIAKYSRGDDIEDIKQDLEDMTDMFCKSWDGGIYEYNLWFASLAYLLGLDSTKLARIRKKLMESDTYDYLIDYVLTGAECDFDNSRVSFPRSYKKLVKSINENDRDALLKYLRGWYKGSQECSWYDTHKITDDALYYGYWCFEAGAVAKRLGLADDDLQNEQYYPYDLVHFI
ncbi:PoNe immunity protein domain-containing protein [uncultured Ruminococcus sp.]|uniref:PoNe immunity protein domain-containing protein n=1 Tax=uncultured Ruminococcus sp. TaxID=165186 RepID=UPI0025D0850F|nr:PoNe immunity protein domain-containing protein [uncultured Ruminococcus sp.]